MVECIVLLVYYVQLIKCDIRKKYIDKKTGHGKYKQYLQK
jgi:hypothetical protein